MGSDGSPLTLDLIKLIQITLLLASFQPFSLPAAPSLKTQGPPPTHKHPLYILSWVSTRSLPPQCLPGGCEALFVTIEASFLGSQCLTVGCTDEQQIHLRASGAVFWSQTSTSLLKCHQGSSDILGTFSLQTHYFWICSSDTASQKEKKDQ